MAKSNERKKKRDKNNKKETKEKNPLASEFLAMPACDNNSLEIKSYDEYIQITLKYTLAMAREC